MHQPIGRKTKGGKKRMIVAYRILERRELPESPTGRRWLEVNITGQLPIYAQMCGLQLISLVPDYRWDERGGDPIILLDRWGRKLHEWPTNYEPSLSDLFEACREAGI
jgi:hypothetical protein